MLNEVVDIVADKFEEDSINEAFAFANLAFVLLALVSGTEAESSSLNSTT